MFGWNECPSSLPSNIVMSEHYTHSRLTALTWVSRYQKGKANLDFTEARDSEWQWRQLGHMQVCISLQTDNHTSTPPLSLLRAGCPSCHPANIVKALIIVINQYTGAILRIHWISLCVAITGELSQNV